MRPRHHQEPGADRIRRIGARFEFLARGELRTERQREQRQQPQCGAWASEPAIYAVTLSQRAMLCARHVAETYAGTRFAGGSRYSVMAKIV